MSNNDWKKRLNIVYSTNPDFNYQTEEEPEIETLAPERQDLRIWLDTHIKGGKRATIVRGFVGSQDDLDTLARKLKSKCGVGGSTRDGEIIIQGDMRDRVLEILTSEGYRARKAGGK